MTRDRTTKPACESAVAPLAADASTKTCGRPNKPQASGDRLPFG